MSGNLSAKDDLKNRLAIRLAAPEDDSFLEKLYILDREPEFAAVGWERQQIALFLKMQFGMQKKAYQMHFPGSKTSVVELNGEPVGRFIIFDDEPETRLVDVTVLPKFRGCGVGSFVLRRLVADSHASGKPIVLRVLKTNSEAIRWYERFGFATVADEELYLSMRRDAAPI